MSNMARSNSGGHGFSVCQPTFDSPLQFCPALGTQELDDLINAYVPGHSPIQEKRALVSMDFFNYSHTTGESFRYYSVPAASSSSSSAGSSPLQDSASGSSFVSPALSNWSWPSASASTPATSFTQEPAPRAKATKKATSASSRASPPDFSHLPGMKIMTKDGRDVTNSASRGCKTKEQRDHAHLMRIIKACDACKKKKIRCDPSHKKRSSGATPQTPAQPTSRTKASAKKKQPTAPEPQIPSQDFMPAVAPSFSQDSLFGDFDLAQMDSLAQDSWDAFVQYDEEPMDLVPADYDFFLDPAGYFSTPESSVSASPMSASAARAPALQAVSAQGGLAVRDQQQQATVASHVPALPYMDTAAPGNDYVDFNLFSPATSFVDDESFPLNDIGTASSVDAYASLPDSAFLEEPIQALSSVNRSQRVSIGGQNVERQQFVCMRDRPEDVVLWDEEVRWDTVNANAPSHAPRGGAQQNVSNSAVATAHGQTYYAAPPGVAPDLSPRSPQLDVSRVAAVDAQHTSIAEVTSSPRPDSHTVGASRRPLSSPSCGIGGSGTDGRLSPRRISTGVPGNSSSWFNDGLARDVAVAPNTVSLVQEATATRAEQQSSHNITALVALGVMATGITPAVLAVSLVQLALGLMVLGALFSPKSTKLAFPEQRIRGTTPLPSTYQEERQGLLSLARSYAAGRAWGPTAQHHPCRHMDYARPVSAVGRLATSTLLALTQ